MKPLFKNTDAKLFKAQSLHVYTSVFLTAGLMLAGSAVKADTPKDATQSTNPPKAAAAPNYVLGSPTYTAKKSITLDGLMKEVYPNSPLHASILSKALQTANSNLLNGKPSQSIKRGATLNIPNHTQLIVETLAPYAPPPPVVSASPSSEENQYGSQSSDPSSRRFWVRFP